MKLPLCGVLSVLAIASTGAASAQWTWTPETGRFVNMKNLPKETPELQVEYTRSLVVGREYSKAWNETDKFDKFYRSSEFAADNQFLRGDIRLGEEKYVDAAKEYQKVISKYPDSKFYNDVIRKQYEIGDSLFDKGQKKMASKTSKFLERSRYIRRLNFMAHRPLKKAVDIYTMVITNQPFTPEAAEAQYKIGKCHFARGQYLEAGLEYRRVVEDYPDSTWVREASYDLTQCYEKASLGPDYDQAPAQLAIDSIGEFKRRFPDDERVTEREAVSVKMRENIAEQRYRTARIYVRRNEPNAARMYFEITATEFSGTEAAKKAAQWLSDNPRQDTLQTAFLGRAVPPAP